MINLGDLTFPSHDPNKSLFSHMLQDHPRRVNAVGSVDFDRDLVGKNCPIVMA